MFSQNLRRSLPFLLALLVITPIGIFVGIQLENSHAPEVLTTQVKSSGGIVISADELIRAVQAEKRVVFWVGRRDGDSYGHRFGRRPIDQVDYLPLDAANVGSNAYDFSVTTFGSHEVYQAQLRPLVPGKKVTFVSPTGANIMYDLSWPYYCVVTFPSEPYVVRIDFSNRQTPESLILQAEHLIPIPAGIQNHFVPPSGMKGP